MVRLLFMSILTEVEPPISIEWPKMSVVVVEVLNNQISMQL